MLYKRLLQNKLIIILLISLAHNILFNTPIIYENYKLHSILKEKAILEFLISFLDSFLASFPFFFSFSYISFIFSIILYFSFFIGAIISYLTYNFHIKLNTSLIGVAFEVNAEEVKGFVEIKFLLWIVFSLLIAFLLNLLFKRTVNKTEYKKMIAITASFVFFAIFFDGNAIKNYIPYNYLSETWQYILERNNLKKPRKDLSKEEFIISNNIHDLNIILVIGESARGDHFHINGYKRQTTPLIEKEKNLVSFKQARSCGILTRDSLPCLLTRATESNTIIGKEETSFIGIFKKLNFNTNWISNQGTYSVIDEPFSVFYKEADNHILLGTNLNAFNLDKTTDEDLLPFIDDFLAKSNHNLLVVHTYGSHWHYESHYPERFQKFKPICELRPLTSSMTHCSDEERINSYDNTILYTDYFLSKIIDKIRSKNAILIYLSDHGESLGEDGYYLHGMGQHRPEQHNVPILFWFSEKYRQTFPQEFEAMNNNCNLAISHDQIFHSILGCSGIKSKLIDDALNLCVESHSLK